MPVKVTPAEFQEKHARRLKASIEDIRRGVGRVTESPTAKAAAKQDKMRTKLNEAIDSGLWASRLNKVTLADWKGDMLEKGVGRISGGIDRSKGKVVDFATQLLPAVERAQAKVAGMPDLTLEDSISRMTEYVREMAKFRKV